jgi:hypothetical protein
MGIAAAALAMMARDEDLFMPTEEKLRRIRGEMARQRREEEKRKRDTQGPNENRSKVKAARKQNRQRKK